MKLKQCLAPQTPRLNLLLFGFAASMALSLPLHAYPLQTLTTNVRPLSGTDNNGDEFPGAVVPFGMVQWSPDTTPAESGGYIYSATQIAGFGLDHLSGAGCDYGGDFAFTPILGTPTNSPYANGGSGKNAFAAAFSHANEMAAPGYYSVRFNNGIRTELTATVRTGFGRFLFPSGNTAGMIINAASSAAGTQDASIQINPNTQEVCGWTIQNPFCGAVQNNILYFDVVFDHPFSTYGTWNGAMLTSGGTNSMGSRAGIYLNFGFLDTGVVLARTALSYVSIANARANLAAESPVSSFTISGFDDAVNAASNIWNFYLNKIQVDGGTAADTATFYTMMYHALQAPSIVSDVNGQYIGFDGQVHSAPGFNKYEYFSGWDIYRNECQFIAMMDPARAGDMAQSLVLDAQQSGTMPRWSVADGDSGVMMGDPATPIIAGIYAFGGTNFDTASALAAMVNAAVNPQVVARNGIHERDAERDYLNLGYVPAAQSGGYGPVSMTLEYCSADFALARFAKELGDTSNYALAMDRAQNWRNLFNSNTGYIQLRNSDAAWSPGFPTFGGAYVEGTADQYLWMVPFNLSSLIGAMGGTQATSARLDKLFTQLNGGFSSTYAFMGKRASNVPEPLDHTNYLGEPWKASDVVHQIMTQLYSTAPGGLPGNDDLGQMASWYVLAALGMHPEMPGDDVLVLNGPLFPQAVVHLAKGDVTITAENAGDNAPYIQSLTVNGQPSTASWIRFSQIANGGTLAFTLGTNPNTNWGSNIADLPPSYTDGMTSPLSGNYVWGTGLETDDIQPNWTNMVDSDPSAGGVSDVGPVVNTVSGPELGVRNENAQSGSKAIMYSGSAKGGASSHAYMKMFDLSRKGITISSGMHFSYWIFPQSRANIDMVSHKNSAYVALDLIFSDGTNLRDSGLTNQYGIPVNPASQGSVLQLDTWNYVTVDLTPLTGKTINRIDLGYSQPNGLGGYRGYVDDLSITVPIRK